MLEGLVRKYRQFSQRELKRRGIDLSEEQLSVLGEIRKNDGVSQRDIALSTGRDPASITRMLDILEKKKLLKRKTSATDRRSFSIVLTDKGKEVMDKAHPVMLELREFSLRKMTKSSRSTFIQTINFIEENLN